MARKLFIAADHAGFELKNEIVLWLKKTGLQIEDLGTNSADSVDYPDYSKKLAEKVLKAKKEDLLEQQGILICGSGVGMSIQSNRFKGIRAVLAWNAEVAKLSRQHNASNVLCLGARLIPFSQAKSIVQAWMETAFEGGRHLRRVEKMDE